MARSFLIIALAVVAIPARAFAGAAEDCNQGQDPRRKIRGCTAFLSQSSNNAGKRVDAGKRAAIAYFNRGYAFSQLGRNNLAIADYTQAIELDPRNILYHYQRGQLLAILGEEKRAEADFNAISEIDAKDPRAARGHALALFNGRNYKDAVTALDEAERKDPKNAWTFFLRGRAQWNLGRLQEAANDLEKSVELDQSSKQRDPRYLLFRGLLRASRQLFDDAKKDFGEALKINPRYAEALVARGNLLAKQGKIEDAVADFDKAIASEPLNAAAYEARGKPVGNKFAEDRLVPDLNGAIEMPSQQGIR